MNREIILSVSLLLMRLTSDYPGCTPTWAREYQELCGGYIRWDVEAGYFKRLGSDQRARFALVDGRVTLLDDGGVGSTRGAVQTFRAKRTIAYLKYRLPAIWRQLTDPSIPWYVEPTHLTRSRPCVN